MSIKSIDAWETDDGQVFLEYDKAVMHEMGSVLNEQVAEYLNALDPVPAQRKMTEYTSLLRDYAEHRLKKDLEASSQVTQVPAPELPLYDTENPPELPLGGLTGSEANFDDVELAPL